MNARQNWQSLAAAVVNMAIRDLRKHRKSLEKKPDDKIVKADIEELEEFFGSDWFRNLLSMSGVEADEKRIEEIVYGH